MASSSSRLPIETEASEEKFSATRATLASHQFVSTYNPAAKTADFYPNGKQFTEDKIASLEAAIWLLKPEPTIYSRDYIVEVLRVPTSRGGVISLIRDNKLTLYAVVKIWDATQQKYKSVVLGEGGYGKIKLLQNLETGEWEALKVWKKSNINEASLVTHILMLDREAETLRLLGLGNGYIIKKRRTHEKQIDYNNAHPTELKYYLIMKLIPGKNLHEILKSGTLSLNDRFNIAFQLANWMTLFQTHGLLHRDLKPKNIMYHSRTNKVTPIDYGLAAEIKSLGELDDKVVGSRGFRADEVKESATYSYASEMYALGRVIQELFGIEDEQETNKGIIRFGRRDPAVIYQLSLMQRNQIEKLTKRMLCFDPALRPTILLFSMEIHLIYTLLCYSQAAATLIKDASLYEVLNMQSHLVLNQLSPEQYPLFIQHIWNKRSLPSFLYLDNLMRQVPNQEAFWLALTNPMNEKLQHIIDTHRDLIELIKRVPRNFRMNFVLSLCDESLNRLYDYELRVQLFELIPQKQIAYLTLVFRVYFLPLAELNPLFHKTQPASSQKFFMPSINSNRTLLLFDEICATVSSRRRYSMLQDYLRDINSTREPFYQNLLHSFGRQAFNAIYIQKAESQVIQSAPAVKKSWFDFSR